jgi:hypothetical protein
VDASDIGRPFERKIMAVTLSDLEDAFLFVSSEDLGTNNAYLNIETGEISYDSEMSDSYELPEDFDEPDKYVSIPHRNELDLGNALAIEFISKYLPGELDKVSSIFHRKRAYTNYKDLLEKKGFLEKWYEFEKEHQDQALRQWCEENDIELYDN